MPKKDRSVAYEAFEPKFLRQLKREAYPNDPHRHHRPLPKSGCPVLVGLPRDSPESESEFQPAYILSDTGEQISREDAEKLMESSPNQSHPHILDAQNSTVNLNSTNSNNPPFTTSLSSLVLEKFPPPQPLSQSPPCTTTSQNIDSPSNTSRRGNFGKFRRDEPSTSVDRVLKPGKSRRKKVTKGKSVKLSFD